MEAIPTRALLWGRHCFWTNFYHMVAHLDSQHCSGRNVCLLHLPKLAWMFSVKSTFIHLFCMDLLLHNIVRSQIKPSFLLRLFRSFLDSFSSFALRHCLKFTGVAVTWHVNCSQLCVQHGNQQKVRRWKIKVYNGVHANQQKYLFWLSIAQSPLNRKELDRHRCVLATVRPRKSFARAPSSRTAMRPSSPGKR